MAHKKDGQVTSGTKIKLSRIEPDEEAVKDLTDPEAEAAKGGSLDLTLGTTLTATHACKGQNSCKGKGSCGVVKEL